MERKENLILRTVYLPVHIDNKLRDIAFRLQMSKGDLIREALDQYLEDEWEEDEPHTQ